MVRRHPHVFADAVATTPEEVLVHWNAAKAAEKRDAALGARRRRAAHALPRARAEAPRPRRQVGVAARRPRCVAVRGRAGRRCWVLSRSRAARWDADRALRGAIRRLEAEVRDAETTKLRDSARVGPITPVRARGCGSEERASPRGTGAIRDLEY
jgi:XTP/dITP diphosphohydrolase